MLQYRRLEFSFELEPVSSKPSSVARSHCLSIRRGTPPAGVLGWVWVCTRFQSRKVPSGLLSPINTLTSCSSPLAVCSWSILILILTLILGVVLLFSVLSGSRGLPWYSIVTIVLEVVLVLVRRVMPRTSSRCW